MIEATRADHTSNARSEEIGQVRESALGAERLFGCLQLNDSHRGSSNDVAEVFTGTFPLFNLRPVISALVIRLV